MPPSTQLRAPAVAAAPELDAAQRLVVAHQGSPLLVLAGPGTGKTTTIVEAVVARLTGGTPQPPEAVLVLTFGRAAAGELRARIAARLAGSPPPTVATFHSLAWALLTAYSEPDLRPQLLLSGPDQDAMIRELLQDPEGPWVSLWPEATREVLDSAALAGELTSFIAAARAHGWDPEHIRRAGAQSFRGPQPGSLPPPAEWPAAAAFFDNYLDLLDLRGAVDYAEAIHRAVLLARANPEIGARFSAIYIDEYQDTDPAQVQLIKALAAPDATVVAVGDPDQAIYRFRGADVRGILSFRDEFRSPSGAPAEVVVLDRTRRFGDTIRAVADRWIEPVSLGTLPAEHRQRHRTPVCEGPDGEVQLLTSASPEEQAAAIADLLRRERFDPSSFMRWSDMAVLVRSGVADIPRLQRALLQAGVPVEVPPGEVPLGSDPALAPLLVGLRLAVEPEPVAVDVVEEYLRSPLVGLTALEIRRIRLALRDREQSVLEGTAEVPRSSGELLRELVIGRESLPDLGDRRLEQRVAAVLEVLQRVGQHSGSLQEKLWLLWCDGGRVPGRWARSLEDRAWQGGLEGQRADVTLDAVVELFRVAQRMPKGAGVGLFLDKLENQHMAAARSEALGFNRDCVRLLTAHRAKGLQWPLVVVVGLQQDSWPAARNPATLLFPDRIGIGGIDEGHTHTELLHDERRLAFVAATRAQRKLVLAAVDTGVDGEAPSELFREAKAALGEDAVELRPPSPRAQLTPASVVASLREALGNPLNSPGLRRAAAQRLAQMAEGGPDALAPQADPAMWWGRMEPTTSDIPLVETEDPVMLSATAMESLGECPMRWFLQRRLHAGGPRGAAQVIGSVVHAAIKAVVEGDVPADEDAVMEKVEEVWRAVPYAASWESQAKLAETRLQVRRFLHWWAQRPTHEAASEMSFDLELGDLEHGPVRVRGAIDLVQRDDDDRVTVVDFKTGKGVVTAKAAQESLQLGSYQWALQQTGAQPAGGALVYLGKGLGEGKLNPAERVQGPLTDDTWILASLDEAARIVREERIVARVNEKCSSCPVRRMCPAHAEIDWLPEPADGPDVPSSSTDERPEAQR